MPNYEESLGTTKRLTEFIPCCLRNDTNTGKVEVQPKWEETPLNQHAYQEKTVKTMSDLSTGYVLYVHFRK